MKKRLVGAVVLIALAVIFVPMLLPNRSGPESASVKIPPQPSGELQTRVLQVGPDSASAGSSTAAAITDPDRVATLDLNGTSSNRQPVEPKASPEVSPPVESAPPASAPQTSAPAALASAQSGPEVAGQVPPPSVPVASAKPEPVPGGAGAAASAIYTVNLGIYADHASANKLVLNAKKHGFAALATPESFQGKSVLRVRVGPFPSKAAAEAARLELQGFEHVSSMTVEATSVNQTGDAPSSAVPAGQPGGWAVQLGAFSTENQANALRDRLRSQGFDGYVDSVGSAKGKLWRVRAGPFATREVAATKRTQIVQRLKIKGDIVTQ